MGQWKLKSRRRKRSKVNFGDKWKKTNENGQKKKQNRRKKKLEKMKKSSENRKN
jgi:hypothetical protein